MNARRIVSTVAAYLVAVLILAGTVIAAQHLLQGREHAAPTPSPSVVAVAPQAPEAEPTDCAEAADWYYEHYVAMIAEARSLAAGEREASPEWLAERIEPAMAGEAEAFAALQACREGVNR